ncbi:hypothetical protein L4C36_00080 [Photobacterium japonica]|uniref:TFIIB-type zinc ribbon-containing protein n=1 Tax=Photobacterium japonica TaxID=2910235 RepID=UPI003D118EE6
MHCTSCRVGLLLPELIDNLFKAHSCIHCGGNWVLIEDYVAWKDEHPEITVPEASQCEPIDTEKALLCPVSGKIMRKFRITAKHTHRLDYSAGVGGVWLDKGEWDLLKQDGLMTSLNAILTVQWQKNIRRDLAKESFTTFYQEKFGEEVYNHVKAMREWIDTQPCKADLRAYLLAEDPYSAER